VTLCFAYGANMDPVHMAEQCPGAIQFGLAELSDHAFGIAAGGYGTVRSAPDHVVRGVLWGLGPDDEASLDEFEGILRAFYRKRSVSVTDASGQPLEAMIYVAVDDAPGVPAPGYMERILDVGEELGFPADYLRELRGHLHAGRRAAGDG
jgi:hypothetical protein